MKRWHKATNRLRDGRYMMLTAAARGVLAGLQELLAEETPITANVSAWAMWLGLDRRIVREAFEAIAAAELLAITSEPKGKQGTFYTVAASDQTPTKTEAAPDQDRGRTDPGSTQHRPKTDPAPDHVSDKSGNDAAFEEPSLYRREESRGEEKRSEERGSRATAPARPPVEEDRLLSSSARMSRRLTAGSDESWVFSEEDLALLSEAGEAIGVPARDLPRKILSYLAKQDGPAFERWHAMPPETVAAWCREGVRLAVRSKGGQEGAGLVPYIGSIIGTRLESGRDLLEQKVVPLTGTGEQGGRATSAREATQGWLQRRRGVAT